MLQTEVHIRCQPVCTSHPKVPLSLNTMEVNYYAKFGASTATGGVRLNSTLMALEVRPSGWGQFSSIHRAQGVHPCWTYHWKGV